MICAVHLVPLPHIKAPKKGHGNVSQWTPPGGARGRPEVEAAGAFRECQAPRAPRLQDKAARRCARTPARPRPLPFTLKGAPHGGLQRPEIKTPRKAHRERLGAAAKEKLSLAATFKLSVRFQDARSRTWAPPGGSEAQSGQQVATLCTSRRGTPSARGSQGWNRQPGPAGQLPAPRNQSRPDSCLLPETRAGLTAACSPQPGAAPPPGRRASASPSAAGPSSPRG